MKESQRYLCCPSTSTACPLPVYSTTLMVPEMQVYKFLPCREGSEDTWPSSHAALSLRPCNGGRPLCSEGSLEDTSTWSVTSPRVPPASCRSVWMCTASKDLQQTPSCSLAVMTSQLHRRGLLLHISDRSLQEICRRWGDRPV